MAGPLRGTENCVFLGSEWCDTITLECSQDSLTDILAPVLVTALGSSFQGIIQRGRNLDDDCPVEVCFIHGLSLQGMRVMSLPYAGEMISVLEKHVN
jgi:hypothetical protein